ncbi:MAG: hypothetical protein DRO11_01320 [Methanobacteriota archaeon]|nr:MAG: hypothetical protein DRO11_01320 [Euryarchaeota archaeon]
MITPLLSYGPRDKHQHHPTNLHLDTLPLQPPNTTIIKHKRLWASPAKKLGTTLTKNQYQNWG